MILFRLVTIIYSLVSILKIGPISEAGGSQRVKDYLRFSTSGVVMQRHFVWHRCGIM